MTDLQLILQMKLGNESAFSEFVNKYYDKILVYCSRHCINKEEAEDYTQETFLHFFSSLSNYKHLGKALNYLYTIAGNLIKNSYNRNVSEPTEDEILDQVPDDRHDTYDRILDRMYIKNAVDSLPEDLMTVIKLFYYEDYSLQEISDELGIGLSLTKYRLTKARNMLKEILNG